MDRLRRVAFRLTEIFDYRTFIVAGAFCTLLLIGYLIVAAVQSAHDANVAANQRGKAASRRIDQLTTQAQKRDAQINSLVATAARQQTGLDALSEQIRRMGGRPVVVVQDNNSDAPTFSVSPSPRPSARPSSSPSPRPSASPRPSPSPSPTCRRLPIVGCPGHAHR